MPNYHREIPNAAAIKAFLNHVSKSGSIVDCHLIEEGGVESIDVHFGKDSLSLAFCEDDVTLLIYNGVKLVYSDLDEDLTKAAQAVRKKVEEVWPMS